MKAHVLIVDDEERMASVVAMALGRAGYECETCNSGVAALAALAEHNADVVVTDWKMPQMDGIELLRQLHTRQPGLPVILLTAHGSVPSAVAAMREGAFDYVTKPFDNDELRAVVARALDMTRLERENRYLRQEVASRYAPEAMVAESDRSKELLVLLRRVAPSRSTVLIQGESGTGKELVARLLHYWSERVGQPFVAVNCKAFAEGVLESELFGHEKGAFTGAIAQRTGCFERAAGGTLFLDEIGETSPDFQAKLLRVLQDGEVLRVGATQSRTVDVRLVAATNRVLREEIAAGRFREDLFFRLNVIPIHLAPLRERREDILPLAHHFLDRHAAEAGRRLHARAGGRAGTAGARLARQCARAGKCHRARRGVGAQRCDHTRRFAARAGCGAAGNGRRRHAARLPRPRRRRTHPRRTRCSERPARRSGAYPGHRAHDVVSDDEAVGVVGLSQFQALTRGQGRPRHPSRSRLVARASLPASGVMCLRPAATRLTPSTWWTYELFLRWLTHRCRCPRRSVSSGRAWPTDCTLVRSSTSHVAVRYFRTLPSVRHAAACRCVRTLSRSGCRPSSR